MTTSTTSPATLSHLLETLPARPPTPPREARQEVEASVKSLLRRTLPNGSEAKLHTPPGTKSPSISATTGSHPTSSRLRKRVEWSSHTEYQEPYESLMSSARYKSSPIPAQLSATSKPIKSILKVSSSPISFGFSAPSDSHQQQHSGSLAEMLESTIKQLAGQDRDTKIDAYMMVARALKGSNNLPDRVALQGKMSLITQFIQRDITCRDEQGATDISLMNHALNLLITFLHFPAIASTISSDFSIFIVDFVIKALESIVLPKDVIRHLMQVVAFQNFQPKVLTLERVGRLIAALVSIEDRLKGKSIIMSRIQIYKRLAQQSRSHMAVHCNWIKDMLIDMLSQIKDIQAQAISLGTDAGFSLRSEKQVMRKATEILQTPDDDQTYIEYYLSRLSEMTKDKQTSTAVPQILSVLTLYIRCPLGRWKYYNVWLKLLQTSFNSSEPLTKQAANQTWARYIYLSLTDSKTNAKILTTLCQPLQSQLRRRAHTKQLEEALKLRRSAMSGVYTLLYYAYAPGSEKHSLDLCWDAAVQPISDELIGLHDKPGIPGDCHIEVAGMLTSLLDVSNQRVWRDDRILDPSPVKLHELPAIDPKWVRKNSDKVFRAIGTVFDGRYSELADPGNLLSRLWKAFAGSIASASAKDIKVTEDTTKFVAQVLTLLSKIWKRGIVETSATATDDFLSSVKRIICTVIDELGLLPFTERKLSITSSNIFELVATPSTRLGRSDGSHNVVRTPLQHLFVLFSALPPGLEDDKPHHTFFGQILNRFFVEKPLRVRVEQSRELLALLPSCSSSPSGPWSLAASNTGLLLDKYRESSVTANEVPNAVSSLGPDYREIVSLLERGLASHTNVPCPAWFNLFDKVSASVKRTCGDVGRALVIVEPITKALLQLPEEHVLLKFSAIVQVVRALFGIAAIEYNSRTIGIVRRRLWGATVVSTTSEEPHLFQALYASGDRILSHLYEDFAQPHAVIETPSTFSVLEQYLSKVPDASFIAALSGLQGGISRWVQDGEYHIQSSDHTPISSSLWLLWETICKRLANPTTTLSDHVPNLEPLLLAAFQSKHQAVSLRIVETWNTVFEGCEKEHEYSEELRSVLASLSNDGDPMMSEDIGLPPEVESNAIILTASPKRQDAASSEAAMQMSSAQKLSFSTVLSDRSGVVSSKSPDKAATPKAGKTKSSKKVNTPLRLHDDSQIQFTAIPSSPPINEESQHLTERQKEIRERQRATALPYTDVRSSPPDNGQSRGENSMGLDEGSTTAGEARKPRVTPERPASYQELISSTPTPRRGQYIDVSDCNDPPSSPPEPRSYPLRNEIMSRSRASNSLQDWNFSSPVSSPVTSRQRMSLEVDSHQLVLTGNTDDEKVSEIERSGRATEQAQELTVEQVDETVPDQMELGNTSQLGHNSVEDLVAEDQNPEDLQGSPSPDEVETPPQAPRTATNTERLIHLSPRSQSQSKEATVHPRLELTSREAPSLGFSQGDETSLMRELIEAEQQQSHQELAEIPTSLSEVRPTANTVSKCITVHIDSCSPLTEKSETVEVRDGSSASPKRGQVVEEEIEASESESGLKKRKHHVTRAEIGRKRRRTRSSRGKDSDEDQQASEEDTPKIARNDRKTQRAAKPSFSTQRRRSSRRKTPTKKPNPAPAKNKEDQEDGIDTDEELMSQLVEEVIAASQSQSRDDPQDNAQEQYIIPRPLPVVKGVSEEGSARNGGVQENVVKPDAHAAVDDTGVSQARPTILETLQSGLNDLRGASLSREEFYKIEDALMDMKMALLEAEKRGRA